MDLKCFFGVESDWGGIGCGGEGEGERRGKGKGGQGREREVGEGRGGEGELYLPSNPCTDFPSFPSSPCRTSSVQVQRSKQGNCLKGFITDMNAGVCPETN